MASQNRSAQARRLQGPQARHQQERAEARKHLAKEVDRLDADIQRFRVEAQRFLAGDLGVPPEELRDRIRNELRRLRGSQLKTTADNFRLGSLEARFNSLLELFGKRIRQQELGERSHRSTDAPPDPEKGVLVGQQLATTAVNALYQGLYLRTGTGTRNPKMDLERFRSYLQRQAEVIRAKTGCQDIVFRVATDTEGKVKLKAKPVRKTS